MKDETSQSVGEIAKESLALGAVAAPFVPNVVAQTALVLAAKYGPQVIDQIQAALSKDVVNLEDIKAIFAGVQPYSSYGIPDAPPAAGSTGTPS